MAPKFVVVGAAVLAGSPEVSAVALSGQWPWQNTWGAPKGAPQQAPAKPKPAMPAFWGFPPPAQPAHAAPAQPYYGFQAPAAWPNFAAKHANPPTTTPLLKNNAPPSTSFHAPIAAFGSGASAVIIPAPTYAPPSEEDLQERVQTPQEKDAINKVLKSMYDAKVKLAGQNVDVGTQRQRIEGERKSAGNLGLDLPLAGTYTQEELQAAMQQRRSNQLAHTTARPAEVPTPPPGVHVATLPHVDKKFMHHLEYHECMHMDGRKQVESESHCQVEADKAEVAWYGFRPDTFECFIATDCLPIPAAKPWLLVHKTTDEAWEEWHPAQGAVRR